METPNVKYWRVLVKGDDQTFLYMHPNKIEEMDSFRGDIVKMTTTKVI